MIKFYLILGRNILYRGLLYEKIGAWVTDIDDTLIESGVTPSDIWIEWLSEKIRILRDSGILLCP